MDRATEIALLDELLGLRQARSAYLDEAVSESPVARHLDQDRYARELDVLFRDRPVPLAHVSELSEDGDFLVRRLAGVEVLLTRDRDGHAHAFLNVCRHRGMQLVPQDAGCRHRFTCPYHAWTWDNTGRLIGIPHREQGFPDLDMADYGLKRVGVAESLGFVWVRIADEVLPPAMLAQHVGALADDFSWIGMAGLQVHAVSERRWAANWKILAEGGLEAYHFRVAHAKTIAGLFHDNLSTYEMLGGHVRSVLARRSVDDLAGMPRDQWSIRQHANLLYTLIPGPIFLVQSDHVVFLQILPEAVDQTTVRMVTLRPSAPLDDKAERYWTRNHALTEETLYEDFEIGEKIQAGLASGANECLTFGRYEGALDRYNTEVEAALMPAREAAE
ncbi:MAG: SRPBCC family protein [Pseudomonadota bacterium]